MLIKHSTAIITEHRAGHELGPRIGYTILGHSQLTTLDKAISRAHENPNIH
jgi:hypothetical protein